MLLHSDLRPVQKDVAARKPISGKLSLTLKAARDLEHAPLPSGFRSSKHFNETTAEFKIHGNVKAISNISRTDRWMQDFDIEMDKADEVEIAFYDQQGGQKYPPPRVLIGVLWIKVSDLLEALRRQKVEESEGGSWVTAATVRGQEDGAPRGGRNGNVDAPLQGGGNQGQVGGPGGMGPGPSGGAGTGGPEGLDGWFIVEPSGAVNLHLDFGELHALPLSRRRALTTACCPQLRRTSADARSTLPAVSAVRALSRSARARSTR